MKIDIQKIHWTFAGKLADSDDSVYIEKDTLKRQGNRITVKAIANNKYKGRYTSYIKHMIVDCSEDMVANTNGYSVHCEGFMCEKPESTFLTAAGPFQKVANDSGAEILVKFICQAR